jgi:hypothetical protein
VNLDSVENKFVPMPSPQSDQAGFTYYKSIASSLDKFSLDIRRALLNN